MSTAVGKIYAIIPAGGVGSRAAQAATQPLPKQYFPMAGQPMIAHSLRTLLQLPRIEAVWVGIAPTDTFFAEQVSLQDPRLQVRACGGATRMETVLNVAHQLVLTPDDWLLVHDAARPGLPLRCVQDLMDTCLARQEGGILALPLADTLKQSDAQARVQKTWPRDGMWQAQTPQMFPALALVAALESALAAGVTTTDEAGAMERLGHPVHLVRGSLYNHKVTYPEDVALMHQLLSAAPPA